MKNRPLFSIVFCTLLTLSGCYKNVYIPVSVCAEPDIPLKQPLVTKSLDRQSTDEQIVKGMIYDIKYLDAYSNQLIELLNGYKSKRQELPILKDGKM